MKSNTPHKFSEIFGRFNRPADFRRDSPWRKNPWCCASQPARQSARQWPQADPSARPGVPRPVRLASPARRAAFSKSSGSFGSEAGRKCGRDKSVPRDFFLAVFHRVDADQKFQPDDVRRRHPVQRFKPRKNSALPRSPSIKMSVSTSQFIFKIPVQFGEFGSDGICGGAVGGFSMIVAKYLPLHFCRA